MASTNISESEQKEIHSKTPPCTDVEKNDNDSKSDFVTHGPRFIITNINKINILVPS